MMSKEFEPMLVKGYSTSKLRVSGLETIYAVFKDGRIMKCDRLYSQNFYVPNNVWKEIDKLPKDVHPLGWVTLGGNRRGKYARHISVNLKGFV